MGRVAIEKLFKSSVSDALHSEGLSRTHSFHKLLAIITNYASRKLDLAKAGGKLTQVSGVTEANRNE
jgi:hypothetical protein